MHFSSSHQNGVGQAMLHKSVNGEGVTAFTQFAPEQQTLGRAFHVKDGQVVRELNHQDIAANPGLASLVPVAVPSNLILLI